MEAFQNSIISLSKSKFRESHDNIELMYMSNRAPAYKSTPLFSGVWLGIFQVDLVTREAVS